jgi:hypothetical protein
VGLVANTSPVFLGAFSGSTKQRSAHMFAPTTMLCRWVIAIELLRLEATKWFSLSSCGGFACEGLALQSWRSAYPSVPAAFSCQLVALALRNLLYRSKTFAQSTQPVGA